MWRPAELTVQFDAQLQVLGLVGLGEFLVVDGVLCLDDFSLVCDAQKLALIRVEFQSSNWLIVQALADYSPKRKVSRLFGHIVILPRVAMK